MVKAITEYAEKKHFLNDITNEPNLSLAVRELIKSAIEYDKLIQQYKEEPEKLNELVEKKAMDIEKQTEEAWIKSLGYTKRSALMKSMREIQDIEYRKDL